jgi:hypothetical protein
MNYKFGSLEVFGIAEIESGLTLCGGLGHHRLSFQTPNATGEDL